MVNNNKMATRMTAASRIALKVILSFSRLFRGRNSCRCFCVELVKRLPMHRNSVDIFSYSGPLGILGSDGKQNTA